MTDFKLRHILHVIVNYSRRKYLYIIYIDIFVPLSRNLTDKVTLQTYRGMARLQVYDTN